MLKKILTSLFVSLLLIVGTTTQARADQNELVNPNIVYFKVSNNVLYLSSIAKENYSEFDTTKEVENATSIPWSTTSYTSVNIENEIKPVSTSYWFANKDIEYIDISNINTVSLTDTSYMFLDCSKLVTIFTNNSKSFSNVDKSTDMFKGCVSLKGESNTIYNEANVDKTYACVTTSSQTGYLSSKLSVPKDIVFANDGTITFTPVAHADIYEYSLDGNNWFVITSGANIKAAIASNPSTKEFKIRSNSVNNNYSASDPVTIPVNIKTVKFVTEASNNQFDYYKQNNVTTNSYARAIKYFYNETLDKKVAMEYLTRTISSEDALISVLLTGGIGKAYSYLEGYISAYFRIGK